MLSNHLIYSLILYAIGSIGVFFQNNLQFINPYFKGKDFLVILVFSIPISICYLKAWTYFVEYTGSLWTAKFTFFVLSYMIFPFLGYMFLNENPFTMKNFICVVLSLAIVLVQYKL